MILMHFTAEWCQPCKMMKPIVQQIVHERDNLNYMPIDIDEMPEVSFEYEVASVPTFVLLNDSGEEISRSVGAKPRQQFLDSLGL